MTPMLCRYSDPVNDSNWLDYVAAGATALSAIVIAWQAWQTRAAVKSSEANVEAAQQSVEVAQQSVKVATQALRESQLARLEAGVPRITVSTENWVETQNAIVETPTEGAPHTTRQIKAEDQFKLPRDARRELYIRHAIIVRNDGPGAVTVAVGPFATAEGGSSEVIVPGAEREYTLTIRKSIAEWIEVLEQGSVKTETNRQTRAVAHRAKVTYVGPRDADVTEVHEVVFTGSLLRPVKDAVGDWEVDVIGWELDMLAEVLPARRTYWRSRSRREKF